MEKTICCVPQRQKYSSGTMTITKERISVCNIALNIPQILDQILNYCEKLLLLQCRFVSRSWSQVSSLHLQKIVSFEFVENTLENKGKVLEELLTLFHNFRQLDFPKKTFICKDFTFRYQTRTCCDPNADDHNKLIRNVILQTFLSTCGAHVQRLRLDFAHHMCDAHIPSEKVIMEEVAKLLTVELPNLKELLLWVGLDYETTNHTVSFPLSLSRIQLNEIRSQYSTLNANRNRNLNMVCFLGRVSANVIEMVQVLAPNLKEIRLTSDKCICLLEPVNRIHLLRCLNYWLDKPATYYFFEKLEQCCSKQILKLRRLKFCLDLFEQSDHNEFPPWMRTKIIGILNTILNCNWDSLENIHWFGGITTTGLNWPQLMPRVKKFMFSNERNTNIETKIFPPTFSWCKTFPCLRRVVFNNYVEGGLPQKLCKALNLELLKRVHSLSTFWNYNQVNETELKRIFGTYFPSAKIDVHVEFNDIPAHDR